MDVRYPTALAAANDAPIFNVTWGDAARFCNWLQNGQPTNLGEAAGSTETGAYTLDGATSNAALMAVTRNAGATYFIPSDNEWYKAAYYDPSNDTFWLFSTQSGSWPSNVLSAGGTDNANFLAFNGSTYFYTDPTNMVTPVGVFAASPGPYGTHDMGGDVYQWEDTPNDDQFRFLQGFCWADGSEPSFYGMIYDPPTVESDDFGFRVASVPEPSTTALLLASAACLLGYIWRRRAAQHEEEKRMA